MNKLIKNLTTLTILATVITLTSCGDSDYEELLDEEQSTIKAYISRNGIKVVSSYPSDSVWEDNVYYRTSSGLYIHIDSLGDRNDTLVANMKIIASYLKKTLDVDPEVVLDYTKEPEEIIYGSSSDASTGMLEAIKIMRCHGASAKFILPSKISNTTDMNSVTPYLYEMSIKLGDR